MHRERLQHATGTRKPCSLYPASRRCLSARSHRRIRGATFVKTYEFDVVLSDAQEVTDDLADELFAAGCDDGTVTSCDGVVWMHFDREAASLEEAIHSAVAQIQNAGFAV